MEDERDSATLHQVAREGAVNLLVQIIKRKLVEADETLSQSSSLSSVSTQSQQRLAFLNEIDEDGMTPLMYAARHNHVQVVDELLKQGARVDVRGDDGLLPLHLAAKHGHDKVLSIILHYQDEKGVVSLVSRGDDYGTTAVHYAVSRTSPSHLACLDILLAAVESPDLLDESQMTPLHTAAAAGNVEGIQMLHAKGANLRAKDCDNGTPMHIAAMEGHCEVGRILLKLAEGSDGSSLPILEDRDLAGNEPLHLAVQNGNFDFINLLLDEGANPNASTVRGYTPLHMAARNGQVEVIKLLRAKRAYQFKRDHKSKLPLHRAAEQGRTEAVKYLLIEEALRPKGLTAQSYSGFTPFISACWSGHESTCLALLQLGANPLAVDKAGKTGLHWAVDGGFLPIVKLLCGKGEFEMQSKHVRTLVTRPDEAGLTPLHVACGFGHTEIAEVLMEAGAKVDAKDASENTPLHYAVRQRHFATVEALLLRDPSLVKDEDDSAQTALHLACVIPRNVKIVTLLLDNGANIDATDDFHQTPLHEAASVGRIVTTQFLIDSDASVNIADKKGFTPLHYACQNGHPRTVKLFLALPWCKVNAQSKDGLTPLDVAAISNNFDVCEVILTSDRWREALNARVRQRHVSENALELGMTPLKRLIQYVPEAALIVLNQCHSNNAGEAGISKDSEDYEVIYDFSFLDNNATKGALSPLQVMVQEKAGMLLGHPVVDTYLEREWRLYGLPIYIFNLIVYLLFVAMMTLFVLDNDVEASIQPGYELSGKSKVAQVWCIVTVFFLLIGELVELSSFDLAGYLTFENAIDWLTYITTLVFMLPLDDQRTRDQWYAGSFAIFLCWITLVIFVRRMAGLGVYIIMLQDTLQTVAKVMVIFSLFIFAFALAFHMLLQNQDNSFVNIGQSVARVFVMMTGEFEFDTIFLGGGDAGCISGGSCSAVITDPCSPCRLLPLPFGGALYVVAILFVLLLHIVLMNLLIGLAVGDIESVSRNAEFARQSLKVDFIYNTQRWVPERWRKLAAKHAMHPHKGLRGHVFARVFSLLKFLASGQGNEAQAEAMNEQHLQSKMRKVLRRAEDAKWRVGTLRFRARDHGRALAAIAEHLDVDLEGVLDAQ
eukprot:m.11770 g.11770  ORF g.11770 m.11770 type:complete len:1113 (+) comp4095_c0_seq1:185-3523(+)